MSTLPKSPRVLPVLLIAALAAAPAALQARPVLDVVASVPDLADIAEAIGGDRVKVIALATGKEDLHAVPARPSHLPRLNRADLLLTLGMEAEHAWLPALVRESRNPRIREGTKGWVDASRGIEALGVPARIDRSEGEQHPQGNPHYNIDPSAGAVMARNVAEALAGADPDGAEAYRKNLEAFLARARALEEELKAKGAALRGVKAVEYHPDLAYLARFYGLDLVGSMEPKPGVPPTASHLARLAQTAKASGVRLVIHNQSQDVRLPERLAREIGATRVEIANAVGAKAGVDSWEALHRHNLEALLKGLSAASGNAP
jgi:zinc/manganese transport system substrate-binding protein